jgi:CheY-like chemotaxis protein
VEITGHLRRIFEPLASDKGVEFAVDLVEPLPHSLRTDRQRLEQVLTNLLGNAIKFTSQGRVSLQVAPAPAGTRLRRRDLARALAEGRTLAFTVSDTGVGIAPRDQELVFTPFERLENKNDARYGSTGLGLSIARELCALLGGELHLESQLGRGSTFTCYLPFEAPAQPGADTGNSDVAPADLHAAASAGTLAPARIADDRATLTASDSSLLLVEDDPVFAERLVDIIRARGFKVLTAPRGEEALELARKHKPSGVILDVQLPDVSGWTVMDRLRRDPETESIPVHFVSAVDAPDRGWAMGAVGYLTKPASNRDLVNMVQSLAPRAAKRLQQILVLEADSGQESLIHLLEADGLRAQRVSSTAAAFEALAAERFVCLILDLGLPDMDGLGFLEQLSARAELARPPVVVYTGRPLTRDETRRIEAYAEAVVLKEGRSGQRLLEEIRLFIHHLEDRLPRERKPRTPRPPGDDRVFRGKRLLVVDDDMRTVYALSALLRTKGIDVLMADTGRAALDTLHQVDGQHQSGAEEPGASNIDAVIMDVMMPEMDGYEAMRRIRAIDRWRELPIIALTAKAMKGEREKCLEAGASDYLSKPIDSGELLTLLSTWLGRRPPDGEARGGH